MRTALVIFVCLLLVLGPAAADEKPATKPKPLTPEQAADKVLEAVSAKDEDALKALAEKDNPDPWLVADLLCYRGNHDAAEAVRQGGAACGCRETVCVRRGLARAQAPQG